VLYLVSEEAPTRTILCAGAGGFSVSKIVETESVWLSPDEQTPEGIAAHWAEINNAATARELQGGFEQSVKMLTVAAQGLGIKLD